MTYCICTPDPTGEDIDIHPECAVHGRHTIDRATVGEDPWGLDRVEPHDVEECAEARRKLRDQRDQALRDLERERLLNGLYTASLVANGISLPEDPIDDLIRAIAKDAV
jgi:hypothetical protein